MPRIFDNIVPPHLVSALKETLESSTHADYCVGYFNLRGWKNLDSYVDGWEGGEGAQCRLLIGMQTSDEEDLRAALSLAGTEDPVDNARALRMRTRMAEAFRQQLTFGAPSNGDEAALRRLSNQLKSGRLVVKLFLKHTLHAKLYLHYRADPNTPVVGFVGSSNLTMAGLVKQGELNLDVLDHDACIKLRDWFQARWNDRFCVDITAELAAVIDESWAREEPIPPYLVYLKMAYRLSREAQSGIAEFAIPADFGNTLFEFQTRAVQIAAHHLNKRGGVLIGDVVGLGKTLMATALARVMEDDQHLETLIICPKNLVKMWEDHVHRYRLHARVISSSRVQAELPTLPRYRVVLIDESHNLRNREGQRYKAISEYIDKNESKCILLSATPYNKGYDDLGSQLGLFVNREADLGIRPEMVIRELGEVEFVRRHQCGLRTLAAFEKSQYPDDWRDLMRLYMVRRTRSFIQDNYADIDSSSGRKYLTFADGTRSYFPTRVPKTVKFDLDQSDPSDPYARLYSTPIVGAIDALSLPRYGLGNYLDPQNGIRPTSMEQAVITGLGRAGQRLIGFCRTNLFKRLESGGPAFIQSVERHALRNFVYLHAVETGQPLPIGTQDATFLDEARFDEDVDTTVPLFSAANADEDVDEPAQTNAAALPGTRSEAEFRRRAREVYDSYAGQYRGRFKWLRTELLKADVLAADLLADSRSLIDVLEKCGTWDPARDPKLASLVDLLAAKHPGDKVLVFTQFADTVRYLADQLPKHGIKAMQGVTGRDADPTGIAWKFSPNSNDKRSQISPSEELRVLIATDVLSEGQNLQDCSIVVNFDLPWAIIRLIQRAGRVDRIGQQAPEIRCYSFLPAEGIERIITLRARVQQRLKQNAEVVGSDEAFFEDQLAEPILDLYNEKSGIFDGDADSEVDLASEAFQIWKSAIDADPSLKAKVQALPDVIYSTKAHIPYPSQPAGVLVYMQTAQDNDSLGWVREDGTIASQSMLAILRAAACDPTTPAIARHELHHQLVKGGVEHLLEEQTSPGGQLGRPSGARFKTYERLKRYEASVSGTLFATPDLGKAIEEIYRFPLFQSATDAINRQLKSGIDDQQLAEMVVALRADNRLCQVTDDDAASEPRIVCSLGLFPGPGL